METFNQTKTSEVLNESAKATTRLYNDITSSMLNLYNKQTNMVFGYYNSLVNYMMGSMAKNAFSGIPSFPTVPFFFQKANGAMDNLFNPFSFLTDSSKMSNPLGHLFENFLNQITNFNKNWLDTLQNNYQIRQKDILVLNEKYQELTRQEITAMQNAISSINENCNKQLDFSVETNKKINSEINKVFNKVLKNSEEFWTDVFKTYNASERSEKSKKSVKDEIYENV